MLSIFGYYCLLLVPCLFFVVVVFLFFFHFPENVQISIKIFSILLFHSRNACFFFLMTHQNSWVIWCQNYPCKRLIVVLSQSWLGFIPKCIRPKVNKIARLEFELVSYTLVVQHISHYTTKLSSSLSYQQEQWVLSVGNNFFLPSCLI